MEKDAELEAGLVDVDGGLPAQAGDEPETEVYEIGYHLLPTLSHDELPGAVSPIMDVLKSEGATLVGEHLPSTIELAYPIAKRIDTVRKNFDKAYFGWVAFEVSKKALVAIKTILDAHPSILRFLLIVTDKDAVATALGGRSSAIQTITPKGDIGKPKRNIEEGGQVSEVALEEALRSIATEDAAVVEKI